MLHDDFVFVRHQTNTEVTKSEWEPTLKAMMSSDALEIADDRCIYENEEILVMHQVMTFPDGSREAVMIVDRLKDGKSSEQRLELHLSSNLKNREDE